jgi:hypothetical protein
MAAPAIYSARVSAGEYPHADGYGSVAFPLTPLSATLVNTPHNNNERQSVKLKIPCGKSNIINSVVIDATGQSLYSVSSDSKRTTLFSCNNNVKVATIEWDRSSPRLVYRRKKLRCKEWLPLAGPETEYAYSRPLSPLNLSASPDLAYSHTVTLNLLGCTDPHLAMCVSFSLIRTPFVGPDMLATATPCQPTRSRGGAVAHQVPL